MPGFLSRVLGLFNNTAATDSAQTVPSAKSFIIEPAPAATPTQEPAETSSDDQDDPISGRHLTDQEISDLYDSGFDPYDEGNEELPSDTQFHLQICEACIRRFDTLDKSLETP